MISRVARSSSANPISSIETTTISTVISAAATGKSGFSRACVDHRLTRHFSSTSVSKRSAPLPMSSECYGKISSENPFHLFCLQHCPQSKYCKVSENPQGIGCLTLRINRITTIKTVPIAIHGKNGFIFGEGVGVMSTTFRMMFCFIRNDICTPTQNFLDQEFLFFS